ncbi:MAG: CHAT domain-containing protein [Leptolyngbya sp. SIO4C5]|nr:CHAT domain-containing protein [Leptolyngbya sp. SIO4C5]
MDDGATLKSILLLAANPKGSVSLRLQEEEREIKERLRLAGYGKVPINSTGATRTRDIQQAMLDFKPQIVHFTGHGTGEDGLAFENVMGHLKLVDSDALANLFKLFSSHVECVVLNACYSRFQAKAIARHIDYVVGMEQAIGDRAAIEFSIGFYTALGAGESIEFAYKLGCIPRRSRRPRASPSGATACPRRGRCGGGFRVRGPTGRCGCRCDSPHSTRSARFPACVRRRCGSGRGRAHLPGRRGCAQPSATAGWRTGA